MTQEEEKDIIERTGLNSKHVKFAFDKIVETQQTIEAIDKEIARVHESMKERGADKRRLWLQIDKLLDERNKHCE